MKGKFIQYDDHLRKDFLFDLTRESMTHQYVQLYKEIDSIPDTIISIFLNDPALINDVVDSGLSLDEWINNHHGLIDGKKFGI